VKIVKTFKRSIKFLCRSCGYPVTAVKGSNCAVTEQCCPCMKGDRKNKMNWKKWVKGMKKAAARKSARLVN